MFINIKLSQYFKTNQIKSSVYKIIKQKAKLLQKILLPSFLMSRKSLNQSLIQNKYRKYQILTKFEKNDQFPVFLFIGKTNNTVEIFAVVFDDNFTSKYEDFQKSIVHIESLRFLQLKEGSKNLIIPINRRDEHLYDYITDKRWQKIGIKDQQKGLRSKLIVTYTIFGTIEDKVTYQMKILKEKQKHNFCLMRRSIFQQIINCYFQQKEKHSLLNKKTTHINQTNSKGFSLEKDQQLNSQEEQNIYELNWEQGQFTNKQQRSESGLEQGQMDIKGFSQYSNFQAQKQLNQKFAILVQNGNPENTYNFNQQYQETFVLEKEYIQLQSQSHQNLQIRGQRYINLNRRDGSTQLQSQGQFQRFRQSVNSAKNPINYSQQSITSQEQESIECGSKTKQLLAIEYAKKMQQKYQKMFDKVLELQFKLIKNVLKLEVYEQNPNNTQNNHQNKQIIQLCTKKYEKKIKQLIQQKQMFKNKYEQLSERINKK